MLKIHFMEEIQKQFPNLTENQILQFQKLEALYQDWNAKINVISFDFLKKYNPEN